MLKAISNPLLTIANCFSARVSTHFFLFSKLEQLKLCWKGDLCFPQVTYCLGFFQIDDAQDEDVITYLFDAPTPEGIFCLNVDKADEKCDEAVKVSM